MRSLLLLAACLAVLAGACQTTATPTATPSATAGGSPVGPVSPGASASPRQWSVYSSDIKAFSLQLPADWQVRAGVEEEGILLQINGGADGRVLLMEDPTEPTETFRSYARRYFDAFLKDDPDAIEFVELAAGPAAHSSVRVGDSISVYYLYPPAGGRAKVLSFSWDHPDPNPVWAMVAERFNPHSSELVVPFATPTPGS